MDEMLPATGLHYPDLSIKGFRGIKDLSIPRLGRVTLVTGKNNTGKSSILEALRLHAQNATPSVIHSILAFREEYTRRLDEEDLPFDPDSMLQVSALFHGFPQIAESFRPIVISTKGRTTHPGSLAMRVEWHTEESDVDGNRRLIPSQRPLFGDPAGVPALVVETDEGKRIYRLDDFERYIPSVRVPTRTRRRSDRRRVPTILVSPYGGEVTQTLGLLWDDIALTDSEADVVEALRIVEPRISAVSMVGGESRARGRTAMVRAKHIHRPVPLRSFGDGVNRLFAMALSLVNARGGILLIDEFENGLHHTVQLDVWRMIFRLAQSLDVQVFATTHSWDAIVAFQKASADSPEESALLGLTYRPDYDGTFATVLFGDELRIVASDSIEVR